MSCPIGHLDQTIGDHTLALHVEPKLHENKGIILFFKKVQKGNMKGAPVMSACLAMKKVLHIFLFFYCEKLKIVIDLNTRRRAREVPIEQVNDFCHTPRSIFFSFSTPNNGNLNYQNLKNEKPTSRGNFFRCIILSEIKQWATSGELFADTGRGTSKRPIGHSNRSSKIIELMFHFSSNSSSVGTWDIA